MCLHSSSLVMFLLEKPDIGSILKKSLKLNKKLDGLKIKNHKGFNKFEANPSLTLVSKSVFLVKVIQKSKKTYLFIYKFFVNSKGQIHKVALVLQKKLTKQTIKVFWAGSIIFGGFHPTNIGSNLSAPSQPQTSITRNWGEDNLSKYLETALKKSLSEKDDKTSHPSQKNKAAIIKKIMKQNSAFEAQEKEKIAHQMPTLSDLHEETNIFSIGLKELLELGSGPQVLLSNTFSNATFLENIQVSMKDSWSFTLEDLLKLGAAAEVEIPNLEKFIDLSQVQPLPPFPKVEVPMKKVENFRNQNDKQKKDVFPMVSNLFSRENKGLIQKQNSSFSPLEKNTSIISFPIAESSPTFQIIHTVRGGTIRVDPGTFRINEAVLNNIFIVLTNELIENLQRPLTKEEVESSEKKALYYNTFSLKKLDAEFRKGEMSTNTYKELSNIIKSKIHIKSFRRLAIGFALSPFLIFLILYILLVLGYCFPLSFYKFFKILPSAEDIAKYGKRPWRYKNIAFIYDENLGHYIVIKVM